MRIVLRWTPATLAIFAACIASAQGTNPEIEAFVPGQAAADVLRESTGSDLAWIPAAMLKPLDKPKDLAALLVYTSDQVSVVQLSGKQVKDALTRSISLFPTPSGAFLQISGLEATFTTSTQGDNAIATMFFGTAKFDESRSYTVAMPTSLARGSLGYFKVWDRAQIVRTLEGQTLESLLKDKPVTASTPRWKKASG